MQTRPEKTSTFVAIVTADATAWTFEITDDGAIARFELSDFVLNPHGPRFSDWLPIGDAIAMTIGIGTPFTWN